MPRTGGLAAFRPCRPEESRVGAILDHLPSYFCEYLAQYPTYSRQIKARIMCEPLALCLCRVQAVWLRFDLADLRNLVSVRYSITSQATFVNISLNIQPTRVKSKLA